MSTSKRSTPLNRQQQKDGFAVVLVGLDAPQMGLFPLAPLVNLPRCPAGLNHKYAGFSGIPTSHLEIAAAAG